MARGPVQVAMEFILRPWVATRDETRERLSAHVEGDVVGREAKRVLRDLAHCRHCGELLRSLVRAADKLRSVGEADAPSPAPSVAHAVITRIRNNGSDRP